MRVLKFTLIFLVLTLLTQVGGLIYLISTLLYHKLSSYRFLQQYKSVKRILFHFLVYLVFTFWIIPPIAGIFGRVPLPVFTHQHLKPRTIWTVLFNRHYTRPALSETVLSITAEMGNKHPDIIVNYFDANHPFYKGYPLFPHLSHNDGKKLDLGFMYNDASTNAISGKTPSAIGYGISEEPKLNEYDRPKECGRDPNNWMYNFMRNIYPQGSKKDYIFNERLTRDLIMLFAQNKSIQKILLEPHLISRLRLHSTKIKQVQCASVRHDDHFHIQIH